MLDVTEMVPVIRMLQHVPTRKFVGPEGNLTDDQSEAADFPDLIAVAEYCKGCDLKDLELVLKSGQDIFNVRLPSLTMLLADN